MGIIRKIIEKTKEIAKELMGLKEKLRLIEVNLANLSSKIQTPVYNIPSPDITKTLDANNIWMGEKNATKYDKMGKLDVYYDEDEKKWKVKGGDWALKLIEEDTVYLIPPGAPVGIQNSNTISYTDNKFIYIPKTSSIRWFLLMTEYRRREYRDTILIDDYIKVGNPQTITGGFIEENMIKIGVAFPYVIRSWYSSNQVGDNEWDAPWTETYRTEIDIHYQLYEILYDWGDRIIS